jgi:hypothetical protein
VSDAYILQIGIENMPNEVRYFLEEIKYKDSRAQGQLLKFQNSKDINVLMMTFGTLYRASNAN